MSQKADMAATMKKLERARAAARSFKAKGINNAAGGPTTLLQTGAGFDPESCWVRLPSGCNDALSETSTPTEWFIDPSNGAGATSCAASRIAAFNSYCARSDAENHWGQHPLHFSTVQSDPASPISDATSVCRAWYISDGPVKHESNQAAADALKSAGTWEKATTQHGGNTAQWQMTDGTGWAVGYKRGCTEVTPDWAVFTICGCYEIWCPIRWDTLSHPDDIYGRDASGVDGSMAVRKTCYSARAVFGCYKKRHGEPATWEVNCGTQNGGSYQRGAGTNAGQWNRYWEQLVF